MLLRKGAYVPGTVHNYTTSATSQTSAAFQSASSIIRVAVGADTYVNLGGSTVTATTANMIIPAGHVEFLAVGGGGATNIAFLQVLTPGYISITELGQF